MAFIDGSIGQDDIGDSNNYHSNHNYIHAVPISIPKYKYVLVDNFFKYIIQQHTMAPVRNYYL